MAREKTECNRKQFQHTNSITSSKSLYNQKTSSPPLITDDHDENSNK